MNTSVKNAYGSFELTRFPIYPKSKAQQNLQAWDGADTLLIEHLHQLAPPKSARVMIINDQFGAISCALARDRSPNNIIIQSDSFLSLTAIERNFNANNIELPEQLYRSTEVNAIKTALGGDCVDHVVMRIPKSLNLLEHQLHELKPLINEKTKIVASSMTKTLSKNTRSIFEKVLGPSTQSLAAHKARLIHCTPAVKSEPEQQGSSTTYPRTFNAHGLSLSCHANVFAEGRVDPGTQVFIAHLQQMTEKKSLIDLGCGSGIMGILSARACHAKQAYFCDESFMAVDSARQNSTSNLADVEVYVEAGNSIPEHFPEVDLVVCNPPFHQQQAMSTDMAMHMFKDAYKHLKPGGELWIVANRHLSYFGPVKRLFGHCENMAQHAKYVVLRAKK